MNFPSGLLPKWIYFTTLFKLSSIIYYFIGIFFASKIRFNYFYILQFLIVLIRFLSVKHLRIKIVFWFTTFSFLIDIVFFVVEWVMFRVGIYKTVGQVFFCLFSIMWMIFLHPYYLMKDENENEKYQ